MEIFRTEEFARMENPNPGTNFRQEIVTSKQKAESMGGLFVLLPAGRQIPYHYHRKRESIIIAVSGEAIEVVEGKEFPIKAKDVLYIPAGEKHMTVNRTDKDFRYLEFFTCLPGPVDFVEVN